jgi:hypothetical protein
MKAIINRAKFNRNTTVYAIVGYYDGNGIYHEENLGNLSIKTLPTRVARNIYPEHDITIQIAPKEEVRMFAKSMSIIESFNSLHSNDEGIKGMFDAFSKYNGPYENGDYIWTTTDIEEEKRIIEETALDFGEEEN